MLRKCLHQNLRFLTISPRNLWRTKATSSSQHETDSCGIPLRPTWSVTQLLSSYPSPTLPTTTVNRLYELSSLAPSEEGTPNFNEVKGNLEEIIKLVEAVRLVDTSGMSLAGYGEKEDADLDTLKTIPLGEAGQELLKHASRKSDQFYVVDSERRQ